MFFRGRFLFFLLLLGLFGLIFSGQRRSGYQDAYWQGYNAGLAVDGAEEAAPAAPPAAYGYERPHRGGWGFFGLFPFFFLFFGVAMIGKLFFGHRHWHRHHGRHGHHGRRWKKGRRHWGRGPWNDDDQDEPSEKGPDDIDDGTVRQA